VERVKAVVESSVEGRTFGILGEPRVNVLLVNLRSIVSSAARPRYRLREERDEDAAKSAAPDQPATPNNPAQ
jgi:hypothetical protein